MSKKERIRYNSAAAKKLLEEIKSCRKNGPRIDENRHSYILYITGCTSDKSLVAEPIPAYKRYIGGASRRMLEFYEKNKSLLDLYILSAGYGFIPANGAIQKYNVSFNNVDSKLREIMAQRLELREDFGKLLDLGYKLVVLRLGPNYIKALNSVDPDKGYESPYKVPDSTTLLYIKPKSTDKILLQPSNGLTIETCGSELKRLSGCGLINDAQDKIWSDFFEKNKDKSTDEIIEKIINIKNLKELFQ